MLLVASSAITRDVYQQMLHPERKDESLAGLSRVVTLGLAVVALATAVAIGGKIGAEQTLAGTEGGDIALSIGLSILIGSVTLTGSLVAYAKLSGKMWKNRFGPVGSQGLNIVLALLAIACVAYGGFMAPGSMSVVPRTILRAGSPMGM